MEDWRELILTKIKNNESHLLILLDPDHLLNDSNLLTSLKKLNFEVIPYTDPIAFRFLYEPSYRMKWDFGVIPQKKLAVVFSITQNRAIPFDLQQEGAIISISLSDIFPFFNRQIIDILGLGLFDSIFIKSHGIVKERLSESKTKEFVLSEVFNLETNRINNKTEFFANLCRIHYEKMNIPDVLVDYFCEQLSSNNQFNNLPLRYLFQPQFFFKFIQQQWPLFLNSVLKGELPSCPFNHPSLRVYINTFFYEGLLKPVEFEQFAQLPEWMLCGISINQDQDLKRRLLGLFDLINDSLQQSVIPIQDWKRLGWRWAEVLSLVYSLEIGQRQENISKVQNIQKNIEAHFEEWIQINFQSMQDTPYLPKPTMVHQILNYIATKSETKIALIIIDGLALDQWVILREELKPKLRLEEDSLFSWIPTLTSFSRRAIFSGEKPFLLNATLQDYDSEKRYWTRFWNERGIPDRDIGYTKGHKLNSPDDVEIILELQQKKVIGIVINTIDDLVSSNIDTSDLHLFTRNWVKKGYLLELIKQLIQNGFVVYLSSDHGNICSTGIGTIQEGILIEEKSARARIYQNTQLREQAIKKIGNGIRWNIEHHGYPYSILLSAGLTAFYKEGEKILTHGAMSLEEVLVPFIRIGQD